MTRPCSTADDAAALANWLDDLFGSGHGFAYAPVGVGGYFEESGGYNFSGGFSKHFFSWPAERDALVDHLLERSRADDVYLAPRLRTCRSAKKGTAHDGRWLYVDLDKPRTGRQQQLLDQLLRGSHCLVYSGTTGHAHLYLQMSTDLPVATLTGQNERLARALNGDSKWQDNAVLRPPGTLSHKPAARGGAPTRVRVHSSSSSRRWTVSALEGLLPSIRAPQSALVSPADATSWDGTVPRNFDELMSQGAVQGERSEKTFALAMGLIENGAGYEDIVEVAHGHSPTAERGRVERNVAIIWNKHPHPGATCGEVGCANATTGRRQLVQVERTVARALADLNQQEWSGRHAARRKVVIGACQLALGFGSTDFFTSDREFAAMSMVARPTLVKRLEELSDWIECLKVGDRQIASEYRLLMRPQLDHNSHSSTCKN